LPEASYKFAEGQCNDIGARQRHDLKPASLAQKQCSSIRFGPLRSSPVQISNFIHSPLLYNPFISVQF